MITLRVVAAPDGFCSRRNLPVSDPATGLLTFTARPARHAWPVGQDMLAAMGVNFGLADNGRNRNEDLRLTHAWLSAWKIKLVVSRHAENLLQSGALDALIDLCATVGAGLVLVSEGPDTQVMIDATRACGGDLLPVEDLFPFVHQRLPSHATASDPGSAGAPAAEAAKREDFPQHLPQVAFPLFRAACRRLLTPAQHARVDEFYVQVYRRTAQAAPPTDVAVAALLQELVAAHPTPGEALTAARACQAQMFTRGIQLQLNLAAFLVAVHDGTHRGLTTAEVRSLRAYRTPWRICAVLLDDAGLDREQIAVLPLRDVSVGGKVRGVKRMHPDAAVYFRAQRHLHVLAGAAPDTPFLSANPMTVQRTLRQVRGDLNLPRLPWGRPVMANKRDRWQHDIGCVLRPLTGTQRSLTGSSR